MRSSGDGLKYIDYLTGFGSTNTMIDESREDGIDNDGDWDIATDDVGLDGMPGSGDLEKGWPSYSGRVLIYLESQILIKRMLMNRSNWFI